MDYAKGAYTHGSWSPDGSRLLITMSYYEGCIPVIISPDQTAPLTQLRAEGAVGCQVMWSVDGQSVLVANPFLTGALPGLWRYDAQTGQQTLAITLDEEDGSTNFIGWPHQLADGTLNFFTRTSRNYFHQRESSFH